ncbi:MAG: alpha/beta fold hydrolase [Gammaproteobacteria bacterium]|nr:alpha/beta fold hydrolase [Gammaproteobacteria bacterium]MDH5803001.1 alpha/beta fold hydrolase [Gammaproteobacteria bacterium]
MNKTEPAVQRVVLMPGLWTSGYFMTFLARAMRKAGFAVSIFSCPYVRCSVESNMDALHRLIDTFEGQPFSIVAHSLGGLLALRTLEQYQPSHFKRLVLLGSPIAGSEAARSFGSFGLGRIMLGHSFDILSRGVNVTGDFDISQIAGCKAEGLGRRVAKLEKLNDGGVSVSETKAPWLKDHLVLNESHAGLLFSPRVAEHTVNYLKSGNFNFSGQVFHKARKEQVCSLG